MTQNKTIDPLTLSQDTETDNDIPFNEPITVKLNERQIHGVLKRYFGRSGYKMCEARLDFAIDAGEKVAEVVLCGNGVPCRCEMQRAQMEANFQRMDNVLAPQKAVLDNDDDLLE